MSRFITSIDFINKKLINEATTKHPESPKKILSGLKLNIEKPNVNPIIIKPYLISIILWSAKKIIVIPKIKIKVEIFRSKPS